MGFRVYAAVDIGASSGRVVAGQVGDSTVTIEVVHRFPNQLVQVDGHLRWDILGLFDQVRTGLGRVAGAESVGIDTWAVDYGLLDDQGDLLSLPIAYRDDRTAISVDVVHAVVAPDELYAVNGLQFLPFTTIYQLVAEQQGPLWGRAAQALLLPDLLAYWLTGVRRTEVTNASTTGLLDVRALRWSASLFDRLDLPADLFPPLELAGFHRGRTPDGIAVTTVGSHDTASAVVAVPAATDHFAFIASGTWSLVGLELAAPVLSEAARRANFTNEIGVDGRTRFLRNVGGLWLFEECLRSWGTRDRDELLAAAGRLPGGGPTIDVDDPVFIPPGNMPERIARALGGRLMSPDQTARCILDSLSAAYARTIHRAVELSGHDVEVVHVVGGGALNELLCRLTASAVGLPVVAGPVEATALGNILIQARAQGAAPASLEELRAVVATSCQTRRYHPA